VTNISFIGTHGVFLNIVSDSFLTVRLLAETQNNLEIGLRSWSANSEVGEDLNMENSIEVRSLRDRSEIIGVVMRYATSIDGRRWEDFGSCFADEVAINVLVTGGWITLSRADLMSICSRIFSHYDATQHISANHQVRITGDEATCLSTLNATHYLAKAPGGPIQRQVGYYEYHLIRSDGWKIDRFVQTVKWEEGNQEMFRLAHEDVGLPSPSHEGARAY
jgi:hypothetical protein